MAQGLGLWGALGAEAEAATVGAWLVALWHTVALWQVWLCGMLQPHGTL